MTDVCKLLYVRFWVRFKKSSHVIREETYYKPKIPKVNIIKFKKTKFYNIYSGDILQKEYYRNIEG